MMRIAGLFTEHPASAGETYGEHMRAALSFAGPLAKATGAALVHAFCPFLFTRTAGVTIATLHDRMARRARAKHAERPGKRRHTLKIAPHSRISRSEAKR